MEVQHSLPRQTNNLLDGGKEILSQNDCVSLHLCLLSSILYIVSFSYPLVFAITVIPNSVVRWVGFAQENSGSHTSHIPPPVSFAARAIFGLSGIANVILFVLTRPGLPLLGFRDNDPEISFPNDKHIARAFWSINTDPTSTTGQADPTPSESGDTNIIQLTGNMGIRLEHESPSKEAS